MASIFRARWLTTGWPTTGWLAGALAAVMLAVMVLAATGLVVGPLVAGPLVGEALGKEPDRAAPEGGVFSGEAARLPADDEKDALGLLFGEADLFLAAEPLVTPAPPDKGDDIRVFLALKNPKNFSSVQIRQGAPRPRMDFLGWGLTVRQGDIFSLAAFGPSGRFRGGATSPRERMPEALRELLKGMVGRWPGVATERLRAFSEIDKKQAKVMGLLVWERLFARFRELHARVGGAGPDLPPARVVPGLPGPGAALKILAVILVIALLALFNMGFARQRRNKLREEMAQKFNKNKPYWRA